jgi:hypothetical protein
VRRGRAAAVTGSAADRLGPPVSYLGLREGVPVYDRSGERIGVVERVLADEGLDIFDGLLIHTEPLPGRHVIASADRVAELHERGVLLHALVEELPEPPPANAHEEEPPAEGRLHALLRRVSDAIGGG